MVPVVATVAVLTVGWLALAKERANSITPATGATPQSTTVVREHGDVSEAAPLVLVHGTLATGHGEGGGTIDPNQGKDPTTTPDGSFHAPDAAPHPATPVDAAPTAPVNFVFGYHATVTRDQESKAMQDVGPAMGMIW